MVRSWAWTSEDLRVSGWNRVGEGREQSVGSHSSNTSFSFPIHATVKESQGFLDFLLYTEDSLYRLADCGDRKAVGTVWQARSEYRRNRGAGLEGPALRHPAFRYPQKLKITCCKFSLRRERDTPDFASFNTPYSRNHLFCNPLVLQRASYATAYTLWYSLL